MNKKIECSMMDCEYCTDDEYCVLSSINTDKYGNCITYEKEKGLDEMGIYFGAQSAQNALDALHEFNCESVTDCSDCVYNANNGCLKEILFDILSLTRV